IGHKSVLAHSGALDAVGLGRSRVDVYRETAARECVPVAEQIAEGALPYRRLVGRTSGGVSDAERSFVNLNLGAAGDLEDHVDRPAARSLIESVARVPAGRKDR